MAEAVDNVQVKFSLSDYFATESRWYCCLMHSSSRVLNLFSQAVVLCLFRFFIAHFAQGERGFEMKFGNRAQFTDIQCRIV